MTVPYRTNDSRLPSICILTPGAKANIKSEVTDIKGWKSHFNIMERYEGVIKNELLIKKITLKHYLCGAQLNSL